MDRRKLFASSGRPVWCYPGCRGSDGTDGLVAMRLEKRLDGNRRIAG
jgi:hypothetical protein